MTILISGGDSFTYGNELADCTLNRFSEKTWSGILADQLGMSYDCTAWGGHSNGSIARRTMAACHKHLAQGHDVKVAVMWSFPSRFDFYFRYNTNEYENPWYTVTPWTHNIDEDVIKDSFETDQPHIFEHYKKNIKNMLTTGLAEFSKTWYKHVGNSGYYETYSSLKDIIFLQDWLKIRNIPYVFTYVDECLFTQEVAGGDDSIITTFRESIDMDKVYNIPEFPGFVIWAKENGYEFGATHPLEKSHEDFTKEIMPFVEHCIK